MVDHGVDAPQIDLEADETAGAVFGLLAEMERE
jgi:hypothetical protein